MSMITQVRDLHGLAERLPSDGLSCGGWRVPRPLPRRFRHPRRLGTDQMDGVTGQHGDPQVGRDATVALVADRAKAELGFQAAEGGLDVGDTPVGPQDRLDISVDVTGAQHIGAGALIGLVVLRPALEAHGRRIGAGVRA